MQCGPLAHKLAYTESASENQVTIQYVASQLAACSNYSLVVQWYKLTLYKSQNNFTKS